MNEKRRTGRKREKLGDDGKRKNGKRVAGYATAFCPAYRAQFVAASDSEGSEPKGFFKSPVYHVG